MSLRVVFMGTPDFAVPTLSEIVGQGHEVAAVYTREAAPAGRGLAPRPSPVETAARRFGLPVFTPAGLRTPEAADEFAALGADVAVVVAYGRILPPSFLDAPELGCLNLHASLLPRWRGAAPIQRAVMAGDDETGVAVMRMEEGLDTGPVAMVERVPIGPDATAGEIHDRLAGIGADLMARALAALSRGSLTFRPQPESGVTVARKIENADARIDWTRPAKAVHDRIRGLSPFPGAFTTLPGPAAERLKVLRSGREPAPAGAAALAPGTLLDDRLLVSCGGSEGAVRLLRVQRPGRQPMEAAEFLRGARLAVGDRLGAATPDASAPGL